jgi:HD-GYP domain-containing protein (c-di-GMP phosphodiesterase class II)
MNHDIDLHGRRTAWLTERLCQQLGVTGREALDTALAALTHDIGKVDLPCELLNKPAKLTEAEQLLMQRHCMLGAKRLIAQAGEDTEDSTTVPVAVALSHHEWWDGRGYPFGLAGSAIPRCARIVAVADVFDALTNARAYKPAWLLDEAVDYIASLRGAQFDPQCADAMLKMARMLPSDWISTAQTWTQRHSAEPMGGGGFRKSARLLDVCQYAQSSDPPQRITDRRCAAGMCEVAGISHVLV